MTLRVGKYDVCLLDLFVDTKTGKLSASKIWLHIANAIMSKVMLTQSNVGWELLAAYGAIVGGSYAGILFLKWKFRDCETKIPHKEKETV